MEAGRLADPASATLVRLHTPRPARSQTRTRIATTANCRGRLMESTRRAMTRRRTMTRRHCERCPAWIWLWLRRWPRRAVRQCWRRQGWSAPRACRPRQTQAPLLAAAAPSRRKTTTRYFRTGTSEPVLRRPRPDRATQAATPSSSRPARRLIGWRAQAARPSCLRHQDGHDEAALRRLRSRSGRRQSS